MERRNFVKRTATLAFGFGLGFPTIKRWYADEGLLQVTDLADIDQQLQGDADQLIKWMRDHGWTDHLKDALGVNLELTGAELKKELIKKIDTGKLSALREKPLSGYDDFAGETLIQPGFPAYSLLYHTLASPRVRPARVKEYPSLQQIDILENYIYALSDWQQLRSLYKISSDKDLVFAVFAYEYRPAFKTG